MSKNIVVVVLDNDDPAHGEISFVQRVDDATGIMERLLESGLPVERLRVFSGIEISPTVTYRPVVSLNGLGDDYQSGHANGDGTKERTGKHE